METTAKGEYYGLVKKVPGRPPIDILAEALPGVILQIYFPKTMYWTGKTGAALYPAHPLAGGAAGRGDCAV